MQGPKYESKRGMRQTCLYNGKFFILGFRKLGHSVWRRAKFWVDFSQFFCYTCSSKNKEMKVNLKVSKNQGYETILTPSLFMSVLRKL